ncbi:MAG: hypothetical protein RBR52_00270 [Thiomonas sp.]|uniref:hypothetical protein n=1 Tax=Thiomonas sp. TaxID=2047785 RepID=UPI002A35F005|nr:hypothetical protein [Thiomonas sp.]MDY0328913.1 hypothetical protein [Thiomonas sp.]
MLRDDTSGMRDTWRYIAKTNSHARDPARLIGNIVFATDTVPELAIDDASDAEIADAIGLTLTDVGGDQNAYERAIRNQRPEIALPHDLRPSQRAPRDRQATLSRRLLKNLRILWSLAPRESRAASQPYVRLYSATIERLAAAFDAAREADRLPWATDAAAAHLVTHQRWSHLGWRQHRRAVDRLRPLIARDARLLAILAPQHMGWLERAACLIEALPSAAQEHENWIELAPKASALLWARSLDAAMYHSDAQPQCAPGYLRWDDFATLAGLLFGPLHAGPNAAKLISAAVVAQRRRGLLPDEFAILRAHA